MNLRLKPKTPSPEGALASSATFATPVPFSTPPIAVPAAAAQASPKSTPVPPPLGAPPPSFVAKPMPPAHAPSSMPPPVSPAKPSYVPTPRNLATSVATPPAKSSPPAVKADKLLAGIVLVVVVVAGIIYGLPYLNRPKSKPQPDTTVAKPATAPASTPAPVPTAPKLVDSPTSAAGQAIASARDVVAAHDSQEKVVASILEGAAPVSAANPPINATPATAALVPAEPVAPVVPPPPPAPPPPPPPTAAFRQFVENIRVSGVFQGENARAMLNNRMVHPGDLVNTKLAITLLRIDVEAKQLIFRDDTGAIISRRY